MGRKEREGGATFGRNGGAWIPDKKGRKEQFLITMSSNSGDGGNPMGSGWWDILRGRRRVEGTRMNERGKKEI